jgi:uncharacterized damage-inducible protein DinB
VLALEGYFFYQADGSYSPALKLADAWWKLADGQLPTQAELLAYLNDVETRIVELLSTRTDEDLRQPFDLVDYSGRTLAGHYAYALRHTMHHQGALSVLATRHGHEGECWR